MDKKILSPTEQPFRPPEIFPESEEKLITGEVRPQAEVVEGSEAPVELSEQQEHTPEAESESAEPEQKFQKDALVSKVESVLSDGLEDEFKKMPKPAQDSFRREGEELAVRLKQMLGRGKADTALAQKEIMRWLRGIPDVNALFLEQAAKIKTDEFRHLT